MIQSINRFSPAFCSLSQYVSLIMSLQCLTDPVIFYFQKIKVVRNYTEHVVVHKFLNTTKTKKHLVCVSRSKCSTYYAIDFYDTLGNLTGTYKRDETFSCIHKRYAASLNFFDSNAFSNVHLRVFRWFFSSKLIFLN